MNSNLSYYATPLVLLLFFAACKRSGNVERNSPVVPLKTEKGILSGTAASKTIGAAGGELMSADGNLKMTVAPGTVANGTTFTVQPITNTLHEGSAERIAYRLLPEGTTFSKPIQLTFSYTEADYKTSAEDLLTVAWQQADGTWKMQPSTLNKTNKTITVETTHFSDWTKTGGFELRIDKEVLRSNEKAKLEVVSVADDDLLAYLTVSAEDNANLTALGNWKIIEGTGSLDAKPSGSRGFVYRATYTAPAAVSSVMNVTITMEVEGFNKIKDPSAPGGVRRTGKIILFGRLIVGDDFLVGTLDGVPFGFWGQNVVAIGSGGAIVIRGADASGEISVNVNGSAAGSYPCGQIIFPGKAGVSINSPGSFFYIHTYIECGQIGEQKFSPSSVELSKWPAIGQQAEGTFSGPVYLADGQCGPRIKMLTLKFSVARSQ